MNPRTGARGGAPRTTEYALFDTALGTCAIAWSDDGIVGIQLPESDEAGTRRRVCDRFGAVGEARPPWEVRRAVDGMRALLGGRRPDLSAITLDMSDVAPFHRRVYEVARDIPVGATLSYGELALEAGAPGAARAVGQALGRNPFAIVVPCHRVTAANGDVGGFSATGGIDTKLRMLELEGTPVPNGRAPDDRRRELAFAVDHLRAADPVVRRLVDRVGPCGLVVQRTASVFAALLEAIVFQQLSGKAAATIHGRVLALLPTSRTGPRAADLLRVSDAELRGAGLSQAKLRAARDLAQRTVEGSLPTLRTLRRMDDEAVIDSLTEVRGVGRWTAEMFLVFRLGRPDVLALDDLGIRKGYQRAFRLPALPARDVVAARAERWRPHRSVASWYLWRAAEQS
jgi:methylated-DNA-[protein]-cysteine S-methyltransferase